MLDRVAGGAFNTGMSAIFQTLARLIREFRHEYPEVRLAYLFGSQARDQARFDSDVDVGIVVKGKADPLLDLRLADKLSAALGRPVDVVVLNQASAILQHEVIRDGVRLFEGSSMERRLYELAAFKDYVDAVYFQKQRIRRLAHG
jgi:uncharacterized protein